MLLFCNFLLRVGQEQNGMIIFIFSLSQSFLTYFGLKWSCNGIFQFFEFFCYFFEFSMPGRVGTKRKDKFYFFFFLGLFQPILAWKEAINLTYGLHYSSSIGWMVLYSSLGKMFPTITCPNIGLFGSSHSSMDFEYSFDMLYLIH